MNKIFYFLLLSTILSGLSALKTAQEDNLNNVKDSNTAFAEKTKSNTTKGAKQINLGYSGLVGVLFMIVFFLILIVFFNLILQTGDFNYKFVKEKMPLGKEY